MAEGDTKKQLTILHLIKGVSANLQLNKLNEAIKTLEKKFLASPVPSSDSDYSSCLEIYRATEDEIRHILNNPEILDCYTA